MFTGESTGRAGWVEAQLPRLWWAFDRHVSGISMQRNDCVWYWTKIDQNKHVYLASWVWNTPTVMMFWIFPIKYANKYVYLYILYLHICIYTGKFCLCFWKQTTSTQKKDPGQVYIHLHHPSADWTWIFNRTWDLWKILHIHATVRIHIPMDYHSYNDLHNIHNQVDSPTWMFQK